MNELLAERSLEQHWEKGEEGGKKRGGRRRKEGGTGIRGTKEEAAYLACIDYLPWVNSIANRRNALLLHLYSSLCGSLALAKGRIEEFAD